MKIKHIISGISPLAYVVGLNFVTINPVNAANLNFTYTLDNTETISASFEGDIVGNEVENIINFEAVYSGAPSIVFDTLDQGDTTFTLDFSEYELLARPETGSADFISFNKRSGAAEGVIVSIPSNSVIAFGSSIDSRNLNIDTGTNTTSTPEPGITLALAVLGSIGCWQKQNKK